MAIKNEEGLFMKYFVLSPTSRDPVHAKASRQAIREYATWIFNHDEDLADSLMKWVKKLDRKDGK